jgi:hydroxypyruvate isomerase
MVHFKGNQLINFQELGPYIGHVQISQVPLRDCPVGDGEINHDFILKKISEVYSDYIGLEYKSKNFEIITYFETIVLLRFYTFI